MSRSPGGDSRLFLNNCIGCHSGMDPLAQAFAYYNYDETAGRIAYTAGAVQPKYRINIGQLQARLRHAGRRLGQLLAPGRQPAAGLGAALPGSGNGAKSMGQELANSDQFAQCQVEKVFKAVCLRPPVDGGRPRRRSTSIMGMFKAGGYKMKQVFAEAAVYCMGQ